VEEKSTRVYATREKLVDPVWFNNQGWEKGVLRKRKRRKTINFSISNPQALPCIIFFNFYFFEISK
jgi:hypothetical protein